MNQHTEMCNCSPKYKSARTSFESSGEAAKWQAFGTPSPPVEQSCALTRCSSSSCASSRRPPALSLSTSLSERQAGKVFSFSSCSTPASSYVFRSISCCEVNRSPRRILIVVDACGDVNTEPLQWALAHVAEPGDFVTFLALLPWLTFPMGVKQWPKLEKISGNEVSEPEFRSMQELYEARGVHLDIKIKSGFPRRDIVADLAKRLEAKWIIFYRWLGKSSSYFTKRLGKKKNIVFLKTKNEGNVTFAAEPEKMQVAKDFQAEVQGSGRRKRLAQWLKMRVQGVTDEE